jgi:anaerobic selenocysteine-containing dehydrogenase
MKQAQRGSGKFEAMDWEEAISLIAGVLGEDPEGIAFLLGLAPDHLYDLLAVLAGTVGAAQPLRLDALAMLEGRTTLAQAAESVFGIRTLPHFDIGGADVIFSFDAQFTETWLSPVAFSRAYGEMRQGSPNRRGYLVQFEPRMSQTGANADEWIPIAPGTEGLVAFTVAHLASEERFLASPRFGEIDIPAVAEVSGLPEEELHRLAALIAAAERPLFIPGGQMAGQEDGLLACETTLAANALLNNLGKPGGIFFPPPDPLSGEPVPPSSSLEDITALVEKMKAGKIKTLFIHNTNPVYNLPPALGFQEALANVPLVISFASAQDETALQADYVLPDHTPLESWGYQRVAVGSTQMVLSGSQPVVSPFYETRSTVDVFLTAATRLGGAAADALPYADEVAFLQSQVSALNGKRGYYSAPEELTFWSLWLQSGGWWQTESGLKTPTAVEGLLSEAMEPEVKPAQENAEYPFQLVIFPHPNLGAGAGANHSWLQETPDPTTTVMWDSWIEINPETAEKLGLLNDDVVRVISPVGEVQAVVYHYPAIHPETVAIPAGQGHTAFGMFADGVGCNPLTLLDGSANQAGGLIFGAAHVRLEKTGERKQLARKESIEGVYGEENPWGR